MLTWSHLGSRLALLAAWLLAIAVLIFPKLSSTLILSFGLSALALVYGPRFLAGTIVWFREKIINYYNITVCRKLTQKIRRQIEASKLATLDDSEKKALCVFLTKAESVRSIRQSIDAGYQGIVFLKKNTEKCRSVLTGISGKKNNEHSGRISHESSSFACVVDSCLPRKVMIVFSRQEHAVLNKKNDAGSCELILECHVLHKTKLRGGQKGGNLHPNKTSVGAFTVCEYSEAWSSETVGARQCAVLRTRADNEERNGVLHSYRIEKSLGETLGRYIARSLENGVSAHTEKMDIIQMLNQIEQQLEKLHSKGFAHMDLKLENVATRYDQAGRLLFSLLDMPSASELSGRGKERFTPWFSEMSNIHGLLFQVVTHNKYNFVIDCETPAVGMYCNIKYDNRYALELLMAEHENRKLRKIAETRSDIPTYFAGEGVRRGDYYVPTSPHTLFHDTWAALYIAFIACECLDDRDWWQARVFLLMQEMFEDYVKWWRGKDGFTEELKGQCIDYMNQEWALKSAIRKLKLSVEKINQDSANKTPGDDKIRSVNV